MTIETTDRLGLPLLAAGQAQKELVHNEALGQLDLLVQPAVEDMLATPPPAPAPGQCWIVGPAPADAWAGHAGAVACWTVNGWRYAAPREGLRVWMTAAGLWAEHGGGEWRMGVVTAAELRIAGERVVGAQAAAVPDPTGGTTVDAEARSAIATILSALRAHGLIAT